MPFATITSKDQLERVHERDFRVAQAAVVVAHRGFLAARPLSSQDVHCV